jgi:hypothetical protein
MNLLAIEMQKLKNFIRNGNDGPESESLIHQYSTLMMTCAFSILKSPDISRLWIDDLEDGEEQREMTEKLNHQ